jgi:hypothetical protein
MRLAPTGDERTRGWNHDRHARICAGAVCRASRRGRGIRCTGLLVPPIERRTETGVGPLGPAGALEARGVKPAVADHAIAHYRNGGTVLLVSGDLPADTISEIMQRCGALEVHLNASEATVAARSESAGRVAGRSQPAHGAGDSPVDGGLLRDADTSERHGRGVEPNVAPSGHPLSEDIAEERKHTP